MYLFNTTTRFNTVWRKLLGWGLVWSNTVTLQSREVKGPRCRGHCQSAQHKSKSCLVPCFFWIVTQNVLMQLCSRNDDSRRKHPTINSTGCRETCLWAIWSDGCILWRATTGYMAYSHPPARLEASWEDSSVICESKWWTPVSIKLPVWVKKQDYGSWSPTGPRFGPSNCCATGHCRHVPQTQNWGHELWWSSIHSCKAPWSARLFSTAVEIHREISRTVLCYYSIACLQRVYYFIFMSPCLQAESLHECNYCIDTLWTPPLKNYNNKNCFFCCFCTTVAWCVLQWRNICLHISIYIPPFTQRNSHDSDRD